MNISHGFHIFRDGPAWCAVGPHFIDLMKSDAGFGDTPEEAVAELTSKFANQSWWRNKPMPKFEEFTLWVEGEPSECDGSAWDRLPPLVKAS